MNQAVKITATDRFLDHPTPETFTQLQRSIKNQFTSGDDSHQLHLLWRRFDEGDAEHVLQECEGLFHRFCASPSFHFLFGQAALSVGDVEQAHISRELSQKCLRFLLETGDGSMESPFQVTYRSDVADILMALGVRKRCQQAIQGQDGPFDVVTLDDGEQIWFTANW